MVSLKEIKSGLSQNAKVSQMAPRMRRKSLRFGEADAYDQFIQERESAIRHFPRTGSEKQAHYPIVVQNKPWGGYGLVFNSLLAQAKIILIQPLQWLSVQYHKHRAETYVPLSGTFGLITAKSAEELRNHKLDIQCFQPGEVAAIQKEDIHALSNPSPNQPLVMLEIQMGDENYKDPWESDNYRLVDPNAKQRSAEDRDNAGKMAPIYSPEEESSIIEAIHNKMQDLNVTTS